MVICLERGADLHMAQLMPLPLTVSCFDKIQIGLLYWYRLTRVVPEKGPLNGCVCVCVFNKNNTIFFLLVLYHRNIIPMVNNTFRRCSTAILKFILALWDNQAVQKDVQPEMHPV